jgi:hypothetical protein
VTIAPIVVSSIMFFIFQWLGPNLLAEFFFPSLNLT